jgi:hypothetical protein
MLLKETLQKFCPKKYIPSEHSVNDNSDDDKNNVDDDDNNDEDSLCLFHTCYLVGTQFAYITVYLQHSSEVEI